jgi:hypothetical protein
MSASQTDFEKANLNKYNLVYLVAFEILIFTKALSYLNVTHVTKCDTLIALSSLLIVWTLIF